jgi:hypothetical protein
MISITGDVATGKKVLDGAAKTVKRTHLELGGKAPVIVFDDADLDAVVEGLRAFGYLQCRAGLHRRLPHLCREESLRQAGRRPQRRRLLHQVQPEDDTKTRSAR